MTLKTLCLLPLSIFLIPLHILGVDIARLSVEDEHSILFISPEDFSFSLETHDGVVLIPSSSEAGLYINNSPVISAKQKPNEPHQFQVNTKDLEAITVTVTILKNGIRFFVTLKNESADLSIHTAGMGPAYGLGDHGGYLKHADVSKSGKSHQLTNDGGTLRWISSFLVFPQQHTAGVVFSRAPMGVEVDQSTYSMSVKQTSHLSCYYFHGSMSEIYQVYQKARHHEGYPDISPKFKLFELGWETWDALGWQTSEKSITDYLNEFISKGYPIRWAVTGSGFWNKGGTTTSFGDWDRQKYNPSSLSEWMHSKNISWMIGQRTNFVALGGPHAAKGRRNGNASMNELSTGPFTKQGLQNNYFYKKDKDYLSGIFPLAPVHLIDSHLPGASDWFYQLYSKWEVDGIKEDTMIRVNDPTIYNGVIHTLAKNGELVMARNGAFSSPGTLLRINDTGGHGNMALRTPMNYLQYAASAAPNNYSDTVGFHSMNDYSDANIRHAWLSSLTAGMAVGKGPWSWSKKHQDLLKNTVDFHYAIGPYLYNAALDSYKTGYPYTMTPMHIAFPDDSNTYEMASADRRQFQWMIGESILATPLLNKTARTMDIYLPAGKWIDYDSGETYVGPKTLKNFSMPVSKTPCFIGGKGMIVLRGEDEQLTAKVPSQSNP
jgi:alpha-glucosidase (family GH31 glycosyl hydrolase)